MFKFFTTQKLFKALMWLLEEAQGSLWIFSFMFLGIFIGTTPEWLDFHAQHGWKPEEIAAWLLGICLIVALFTKLGEWLDKRYNLTGGNEHGQKEKRLAIQKSQ